MPLTTSRKPNQPIARVPFVVSMGLLAVAALLLVAHYARSSGHPFAPDLAKLMPLMSSLIAIAAILSISAQYRDTTARVGLRIGWGLLGAFVLFGVGLLFMPASVESKEFDFVESAFVFACVSAVGQVAVFVLRWRAGFAQPR